MLFAKGCFIRGIFFMTFLAIYGVYSGSSRLYDIYSVELPCFFIYSCENNANVKEVYRLWFKE